MKVLAIIPAYNEEGSIVKTVESLISTLPDIDYIIIDDGSEDATPDLCKRHGFNFLSLPVNLGLAGAFRAGMKYARRHGYDAALQFDADGQHLPESIKIMCDEMSASGANIVIGSRFVKKKKPVSPRMAGSILISSAIRITTGKRIADPTSGLRLYDQTLIESFAREEDYSPEPDTIALLVRKGSTVSEVQTEMRERIAGQSYLTFSKSLSYMLRICISILIVQWFR